MNMRSPCPSCGTLEGRIDVRGGQNCVFCQGCGRHVYNAPKTETGEQRRSVTTVHNGIRPSQRTRILERASGRCEVCGGGVNLHVGHVLSVDDGLKYGLTEHELNDDENLCCLCEECNLGMGCLSMAPRLHALLLIRRLRA